MTRINHGDMDRGGDYIKQLELRKGEAEKLVQVIGNTGMVGGYQKVANQERISAWIWHVLTLVFITGLITFASLRFIPRFKETFVLECLVPALSLLLRLE